MTLDQAIQILEKRASVALTLANAERGAAAKDAGKRQREFATAIAIILANLPEGARNSPPEGGR